ADDPNYKRAMAEGAAGVWTPELQRLAGAPAIQQAARASTPALANRAITEGFTAPRVNPLTTDQYGRAVLRSTPDGRALVVPDLRFWDQVKRIIGDRIEVAKRAGNNSAVGELTALNRELIANLDAAVPAYAKARGAHAAFSGASDALEAGRNFV